MATTPTSNVAASLEKARNHPDPGVWEGAVTKAALLLLAMKFTKIFSKLPERAFLVPDPAGWARAETATLVQKMRAGNYSPAETVNRVMGLGKRIDAMAEDIKHRETQIEIRVEAQALQQALDDHIIVSEPDLAVSEEDLTTPAGGSVVIPDDIEYTPEEEDVTPEDKDVFLVWMAERNACPYCLALQGSKVRPDEFFPQSDLRIRPGLPLKEPPAHPHCRCKLAIVKPTTTQILVFNKSREPEYIGVDDAFTQALKREAARSAAYGWTDYPQEWTDIQKLADRALRTSTPLPARVRRKAGEVAKTGQRFPVQVQSSVYSRRKLKGK